MMSNCGYGIIGFIKTNWLHALFVESRCKQLTKSGLSSEPPAPAYVEASENMN